MPVVIRNTPPGYHWGWYSREDPRMHLQTVGGQQPTRHLASVGQWQRTLLPDQLSQVRAFDVLHHEHQQLPDLKGVIGPDDIVVVEPVAVGNDLPALPIFLTEDDYIPASLEETYQASWAVYPANLKSLLELPETGD